MPDWSKLPAVKAELNFIGDEVNGVARFFKAPEHPPDHLPHVSQKVCIHDASSVADELSFDREGVVKAKFEDPCKDHDDRAQLETLWLPAMQETLKRATGADLVFTWAFGRRYSPSLPESKRTEVTAPARMVHGDFAPGPIGLHIDNRPVADVIAELVGTDKPLRWKACNFWQATSPPPHDYPLAFCDNTTARAEDFVSAQGRSTYENGLSVDFEVSWFKYNDRQRWMYFRDLKPDEALIFCGLDMEAGSMAHRVAHSAFHHPDIPADAIPRRSAESRNILVWT